ncbi:MAG: 4-hydroxy-tetrahydrodipicolinate reductase [Spirochaetaceae bacterium]|jgi:4-hydroxy-tetrahydrodipicolinate reductase|nr:4-hydroxy-tetrahydrodipicolinate reductase [Spirochaetaceae bacterium]
MNLIISGYGKMGKAIEKKAVEKGWKIAFVIDQQYEKETAWSGSPIYKSLNDVKMAAQANSVAVDFTHPDAAFDNIKNFAEKKIPLVIGTTGWLDKLDEARRIVEKNESCLLWSSNFSLGVNLFYKIAEYAASLMDKYDEYDAGGWEFHHNQKADSPSGTAKILAQKILAKSSRKTTAVYDKLERPPKPSELHFASLRIGAVPGEHGLLFDCGADSIQIKHTARNRDGLVSGALSACKWLLEQSLLGKSGVWTFEEACE